MARFVARRYVVLRTARKERKPLVRSACQSLPNHHGQGGFSCPGLLDTRFLVKWALVSVPLIVAAVLAATLAVAQAAPPVSGTVIEGVSVPGAALDSTRAQIEASFGSPSYCQGPTQGFCTYNISGQGQVNVRYRAADGSPAANGTPDDDAYNLRWSGMPGWQTTAGVTTANAVNDPGFVIAAYPNATVQYNQFGIYNVVDRDLGIEVKWVRDLYSGTVYVEMNIFAGTVGGSSTVTPTATPSPTPTATPAPHTRTLHVSDISMSSRRGDARADVTVRDQDGSRLSGATVLAVWRFPNGSTQMLSAVTNSSGRATFIVDSARGTHTIQITDVSLNGYTLDVGASDLQESAYFKR